MTETVNLSIENHIATITFNRPQAMNAYNDQMAQALATITTEVRLNESVRAVCLQGAGKLFMAGGDINYFRDNLDNMAAPVLPLMQLLTLTIENITQMAKPVLAKVHGAAAGVGLSLMLACDLVMVADNTKFTTAYGQLGLSPDGGMSYFLPRLVGTKKAMELILLAEQFDTSVANQHGLVNWVVAADDLEEKAQALLQRLAQGATRAIASSKHLINRSQDYSLTEQLQREMQYFLKTSQSQDFKQGVQAFLNKSKPAFTGE